MEFSNRKFNVKGTNERISPQGHFLVQLKKEDIKACNLKANSDVIITHDIKDVNGKKKNIEIKVLARLHEYSKEEKETDKYVIRLDQTIRAAIGVNKKVDSSSYHEVSIGKVPKKRKEPFSEWLFGFGRQRSVARVLMASYTDMEVDICRIRETTMECIGIENGDKIVIESTTMSINIRALNLSEQMVTVRDKAQEKDDSIYSLKKNPRLLAIKEINKDDDLPLIFIDLDARIKLGVEVGDPVVISRNTRYAISKNIQSFTIPLIAMLVGVLEGVEFFVESADNKTILLVKSISYLLASIFIIYFNLLPVKNKFK